MNEKKKKIAAVFCMVVLIMSVLTVGISSSLDYSSEESESDEDILLVTIDENSDEDKLQGMEILYRYDHYALVHGDENTVQRLENDGLRVNTLPSRTVVHVGGQKFDFTEGEPEVSEEMRIEDYEPGEKGLYIVHMLGPIASEWVEEVEDLDIDVMNYVHNYAYRVRMTPEQAEEVSELGFVDWVGVYHPEYKLKSDLEPGMVEIGLVSGAEYETVEQIGEIAGVDISNNKEVSAESEAGNEFESYKQSVLREKKEKENDDNLPKFSYVELRNGESKVTVEVNSEKDLYEIATLNDVYYINEHAGVELHDEMATQTIGGGLWFFDDGPEADGEWWEGDPWYPYREQGEYGSYMNQIGYTGDEVTIGVADTGIYADHDDFQDRVIGGYDFTPDEDPFLDGVGHGTHCTGSAAGDTYHGTGEILYPDVPDLLDYYLGQGSAPDAELFSAKIFDAAGSSYVPSPVTPIFTEANEAGAYVHSNSWGSTAGHGEYIYSSPEFDAAVRDSNPDTDNNEPMVITSSAGNDGEMGTPPPATAKNVIVVGATQPFNPVLGNENPEYMADFSSRGFTDDNRVKPDVVAPGNNIYSTMPDGGYDVMGGTSMSNPAVAGAAAVTVEWYEDTYGYTPSPAMVRSLLINTANPIDGDTRGPIPNEDEGWGMVDISKLQRPDPTSIYTVDQEDMFTTSGMVYDYEIEHEDPEEPLKVTLGWTDKEAPVDTGSDPALLNDLNLEIESPGGHIYRGNALENGWSQSNEDATDTFDRTGDGWDDTNNVENIYIPADEVEKGIYTVKVEGRNIVDDAIGIGGPSQDFALTAYNAQGGEIVDEPPTVEIDRPEEGDVWQARTDEDIEWTATPGDNDLDSVNIFYSEDGWVTQNLIAEGLDPDVGSHTWTLPNINSSEVQVRAVVVDVEGYSEEDYSSDFTIEGIPPEPPENLLVEYDHTLEEQIFYDDVEGGDLGYTTDSTGATNLWDI
ncbi:MAG: S8 family serine peptidase, partial [Candidatus Saliniplasma sp.]